MSHSDHEDKKKKIRERNKRNWMIFQHADLHREQVDLGAPEITIKQGENKKQEFEKVWSSKLVAVRNRLNNSKRISNERWNRFAGTSDGGGRGL